jgi:hypothetical protein
VAPATYQEARHLGSAARNICPGLGGHLTIKDARREDEEDEDDESDVEEKDEAEADEDSDDRP